MSLSLNHIALFSSFQQFREIRETFAKRKGELERRLDPNEVGRILDSALVASERRYRSWLGVSMVLYAALTVLLLWGAWSAKSLLPSPSEKAPATLNRASAEDPGPAEPTRTP